MVPLMAALRTRVAPGAVLRLRAMLSMTLVSIALSIPVGSSESSSGHFLKATFSGRGKICTVKVAECLDREVVGGLVGV